MSIIELEIKNGEVVNSYKFKGPSNWKEMEKRHLILWAATMSSNIKTINAKVLLAALLFKMPFRVISKILQHKDRIRLTQYIDFLFKKNQLTTWLIPSFWFGFRKYYGPADKLLNLTAEEFGFCELCYENFQKTKNKAFITALVAILYRPKRYFNIDDDIRKPLTRFSRDKRESKFSKLSDRTIWSIYLNYEGCRNYIVATYREVYKKSSGGPTNSASSSWEKVTQSAAGGIFGTLQQTEKSNIHKFLAELNDRLRDMPKS